MAKPLRISGPGTYFVSSQTQARHPHFLKPATAELFLETLQHYRKEGNFKLHAFVVMPDHIHLLLTPNELTLERVMMLIKGGFSRRLESKFPFWQRSFTDRRMRDKEDFLKHLNYIHHNPVRARLCQRPEDYPYSSAHKPTSAAEADFGAGPGRHG
jgi:putative transposase